MMNLEKIKLLMNLEDDKFGEDIPFGDDNFGQDTLGDDKFG